MGFAGRGVMKGRIAIPIHDEYGQLIAYAGRWAANPVPDEESRYKLPEGFISRRSYTIFIEFTNLLGRRD